MPIEQLETKYNLKKKVREEKTEGIRRKLQINTEEKEPVQHIKSTVETYTRRSTSKDIARPNYE